MRILCAHTFVIWMNVLGLGLLAAQHCYNEYRCFVYEHFNSDKKSLTLYWKQ